VAGSWGISAHGARVPRWVCGRGSVPRRSRQAALAGRVPLPICSAPNHWVTARGLRHCRRCGRQTSVTAGTLFADTHLPLRLWFEALWRVTSQKGGTSALGLQRALGLGSYRTAWNLLHKLCRAMVRPGRDRLQGVVEVDEIFIGGPRPGKRGRGAEGKAGRDCSTTGGQRDRPHPADARGGRFGQQSGGGDRCRPRTRQLLRLMQQAVDLTPVPARELLGGNAIPNDPTD
jgi:hypothetical protein